MCVLGASLRRPRRCLVLTKQWDSLDVGESQDSTYLLCDSAERSEKGWVSSTRAVPGYQRFIERHRDKFWKTALSDRVPSSRVFRRERVFELLRPLPNQETLSPLSTDRLLRRYVQVHHVDVTKKNNEFYSFAEENCSLVPLFGLSLSKSHVAGVRRCVAWRRKRTKHGVLPRATSSHRPLTSSSGK